MYICMYSQLLKLKLCYISESLHLVVLAAVAY